MRRVLLLLPLLLLTPQLAGCLPVLEACTAPGDPDTVWSDPDLCSNPCFEDLDRDGHGAVPAPAMYWDPSSDDWGEWGGVTDQAEACKAAGYAVTAGDCDDEDPRRFLGNREVCDGIDNDCINRDPDSQLNVDEPVFGEEPVPDMPDGLYSCSPIEDTWIQLFVLAGSTVGGDPVGPSGVVQLHPGQEVDATLRIGALVPSDVTDPIAGGLSLSWQEPHLAGFLPLIDHIGAPDEELSPVYRVFERSIEGLTVPPGAQIGTSYLATLAATEAPSGLYPGSLTFPWYCYDEGEFGPDTPPCPPVWTEQLQGAGFPDEDLADMDTLDLAGCVESGQARLPTLIHAFDENLDVCTIEPLGPPCFPIYTTQSVGCAYLELAVVPEEGS